MEEITAITYVVVRKNEEVEVVFDELIDKFTTRTLADDPEISDGGFALAWGLFKERHLAAMYAVNTEELANKLADARQQELPAAYVGRAKDALDRLIDYRNFDVRR